MIENEIKITGKPAKKIDVLYNLISKIVFFMLILCKTLELSNLNELISFNEINKYLVYVLILFTALQFTVAKFHLARFLLFFSLVVVFFISYYNSGNNTLVTELIIVYCIGLSQKITDYYLIMFRALIVAFFIVMFSLTIGIIQNQIQYRLGDPRYTLGFRLAIYPPGILYVITSLYIFLQKGKIKLGVFILILANFVIMVLCSGRTYFLQICLIIFFLFLIKMTKETITKNFWAKVLYISCITLLLIGLCFSIYAALRFNLMDSNWQKINELLSNRLLFASNYLNSYNLKLFGQTILIESSEQTIKTGLGGMTLDNTYLYLLIHFGIFVFITVLFLLIRLLKRLYEQNDYISLLLWFSMISTMISGNNILFLNRNFLILQFALLMIPKTDKIHTSLER